MKTKKLIAIALLLLTQISCEVSDIKEESAKLFKPNSLSLTYPNEVFDDSNRPNFTIDSYGNYICEPWNYEKTENSTRKYPVLIYLHDYKQNGYFRNLAYMGYENSDGYMLDIAKNFKKTYPCIIYIPQTSESWNTANLISAIENIKTNYRVDSDRIYIHGYAMGGSAAVALANAYAPQQLFAGIIRLNGMGSQPAINETVASKSSFWLMVGLQDNQQRIDATHGMYSYLKNHSSNNGGIESLQLDYVIGSKHINTYSVTVNGIERLKESEYINSGYAISSFPFDDPAIFQWLFNQTLATTENYTVLFDSVNGSTVESQLVTENSKATQPAAPTRLGFSFDGWYRETGYINKWNFDSDLVVGNITLYAKWINNNVPEIFEESNRPNLTKYADPVNNDYYFSPPWNYEKDYNSTRKYPLIIYLHGSSQTDYLRNLYYMGYDNSDGYKKDVSKNFKTTYPCFAYVPQEPNGPWNNTKLIAQIEKIKADYRIDTNRIYLHGFSMGGGATYSLASAYYNYNGQLFAGIIRLNGQGSYVSLRDEIVQKTSIWLMIGLGDESSRISGIRNAYSFLKNHTYNSGSVESEKLNYMVGTHKANTIILTKDGITIAKKTEYPDDAHFITEFPFIDQEVMTWLFSQSLEKR